MGRFGNRAENQAREEAAATESERLRALSPAELAAEVLPAFGPDGIGAKPGHRKGHGSTSTHRLTCLDENALEQGDVSTNSRDRRPRMGLFGRKDKDTAPDTGRVKLTDPGALHRKGTLGRAAILDIETKPSSAGNIADPALNCTLTLEVRREGEAPYRARVLQRMTRSTLALLNGDGVVAPVWIDPKDPTRVAVDVAAGPIERPSAAAS